jgi:diguanylate cyclase (GGDEF)-like protein
MKLQAALLRSIRSRLARRILILFFFCALVPTATVALLAFSEVSSTLYSHSKTRLRQLSKSTGMEIYERLLVLEADLPALKESLLLEPEGEGPPSLPNWITRRFEAVALVDDEGGVVPLLGAPGTLPPLTPSQTRHIGSGGTTVVTAFDGVRPRIYMVQSLDPASPKPARILWRLNNDYLWAGPGTNQRDPTSDYCVLDAWGRVFYCSTEQLAAFPEHARLKMQRSTSGYFDWEPKETAHLAAYWTVFLKGNFASLAWTLVATQPKPQISGPVAQFTRQFLLVVAGALCLVLLLSINQIRRSLGPLEALQRGTRQIAKGLFAARVEVASEDEFEELADSFNTMAHQLDRQFKALSTMAEIDRAVLSVIDRSSIVTTLLQRLPDLLPCDAASVTLVDVRGGPIAETQTRMVHRPGDERKERCTLSEQELDELRTQPEMILFEEEDALPSYLLPLATEGIRSFLVLPIFFKSELLGIIVLGRETATSSSPDELVQVRRLTDQVGVALSNVRMFEQVRFLAYYDTLTGLPNRTLFQERVADALLQSRRYDTSFAVFLIDLDHFKRINDTLGHAAGDGVLQAVAHRVSESLRQSDLVARGGLTGGGPNIARLGGDEFTVLLTQIGDPQDAATAAARILASFDREFTIGTREVFLTASIGIAVSPIDGEETDTLLKNADAAMYHAKDQGRNNFQFYRESMSAVALERLTMESKLRGALDRDEFVIHYQPVVSIRTGQIVGVEALVRWCDPDSGVVAPAHFIPIVEESAAIISLGEWVLRTACRQARQWEEAGLPGVRVAVNVSGRQFRDESMPSRVRGALRETGFDPSRLVLEITESILMERVRESAIMDELRSIGVRISIDDFGTGYSSLSYLTQFSLDSLKIDQSFIRRVDTAPDGAAITAAIVAMARRLGLKVVAEGVETLEELEFLRAEECDEIQGYLFSEPVPAETIAQYLREGKRLEA